MLSVYNVSMWKKIGKKLEKRLHQKLCAFYKLDQKQTSVSSIRGLLYTVHVCWRHTSIVQKKIIGRPYDWSVICIFTVDTLG